MDKLVDMKALFIIVNAAAAEEVTEIACQAGVKGATVLSARGEGAQHESIFGLTIDTEKKVVFSVTDSETAEKVMAEIKEKAGIKTPAHSICFTMPVEKTLGLTIS